MDSETGTSPVHTETPSSPKTHLSQGQERPNFLWRIKERLRKIRQPKRKLLAVISILAVGIAAYLIFDRSEGDGFSKLLIDPAYAQDNFDVTATEADSIGVKDTTAFLITSKDDIENADALRGSITITPEAAFDFEKIDKQNFKVRPKSALSGRKVYKLAIASAYIAEDGTKKERDYSWAFQVKDIFKVAQTLPGNETSYVPLDSGIEITFSQDNFINYEDKIRIEPETKGRFEKHGRTLAFVPENLSAGTLYTVTVSKELEVEGSGERLAEDYILRFETDPTGAARGNHNVLEFERPFSEFPTDQSAVFGIYQYGNGIGEVAAKVYGFAEEAAFSEALKRRGEVPYWAFYSRETYMMDTAGLGKVAEYKLPIASYSNNHQQFFTLPDVLPRGYYLVEIAAAGMTRQAFFQVSDLGAYASVTASDTLVWVHDLKSKKPVEGASIESVDGAKAFTDKEGVATFRTESFLSLKEGEQKSTFLRLRSGDFTSIVPLDLSYSKSYDNSGADDYWYYFYTDRSLYMPNDTVNLWGYLKGRRGEIAEKELTVRLLQNDYYDYYFDPIVISETRAEIKDGAIGGQLKLENVTPGYYTMELLLGDKRVAVRYIEIQTYTKPAYDITVNAHKNAIFAGEDIRIEAKASFFEGTPVADMELAYSNNENLSGSVKTDTAGAAGFTVPTAYRDCAAQECYYYPNYYPVFIRPAKSEEGEISAEAALYVFGPKVALRGDFTKVDDAKARITAQVNKVDLEKINAGTANAYDGFYGSAVSGAVVHAELTEINYKKVEAGEYYDFINKIVRKQYNYVRADKSLGTFDIPTDAEGKLAYELPISLDRSYKVKLSVSDGQGRAAFAVQYLYTFDDNDYDYDFYHLAFEGLSDGDTDPEFSVGDEVKLEFKNAQKKLSASGKNDFLYYRLQNGMISHDLSSQPDYDFNFEEKYIPGVYVEGVWFDGRTYHETDTTTWWRSNDSLYVGFKESDRKLNIEVTADKEKYAPGEEVTLRAKATKADGSAVKAELNLNLVDEAFYELSQESADTLGELYGNAFSAGKLVSYSTHEPPLPFSGAEGGGCFTAGTKVLMADGSEKNIEEVKVGDEILTFENEFAKKKVSARVLETFRHKVRGYLIINGELEVTPEHRVFVNGGWQMIGEAKVGDALVNEKGERVIIRTIERRRADAAVYNLRVERYGTYIADGIYVHNDKDGGRELFVDNALFASVATDEKGEAVVKFKLPDNLTSWRVTAQSISGDLFAGSGVSQVLVSLPAFVTMTAAEEYLSFDQPVIKVNSFGAALTKGDAVELMLESSTLALSEKRAGKAFAAEYFTLPALSAGVHKLSASLGAGDNKDKLTRPITVKDSRLVAGERKYYDLSEGLRLTGGATGRTEIVFTDKERGQFYAMLSELGWTSGDRVDQKLSRVLSDALREEYFDEKSPGEKFDGQIYQMEDGGLALLPYGSSDLALTAKIAALSPQYFDTDSMKKYLYSVYNSPEATGEEVGLSLWGLSALGEPVLIPVQHFSRVGDLSVPAKIYTALAAYAIGDEEAARDIYGGILEEYGENYDYYVRLKYGDDDALNLQATALLTVLAGGFGDRYRDNLWNYVSEKYSAEVLTNLEQLLYIKESLPKLRSGASGFTLEAAGRKEKVTIENGSTYKLSVTPAELSQLRFSGIEGHIGVVSSFEIPVTAEMKSKADPALSVSRQYLVSGAATDTFSENSLVEVRLDLGVKNDAPGEDFQVTDFLPSGLKIVTNPFARGRAYDHCARYPYEINGQEVKFYLGKSWLNSPDNTCGGYLKYYARVVSPGTYAAEPAVIESLRVSDMKNYSAPGLITIKKADDAPDL